VTNLIGFSSAKLEEEDAEEIVAAAAATAKMSRRESDEMREAAAIAVERWKYGIGAGSATWRKSNGYL